MGVKGLTSYVRQVQKTVSEQVDLPVEGGKSEQHGPLIIDGWAWIFHAYLTHFADSIRGGDYPAFSAYLTTFVQALRRASLDPVFVFDGPYLPLKMPTVLARQNAVASSNSAFMRSTSRTNPRFQTQMGLIPPLLYDCTLHALRSMQVEVIIAESEADSAVADLANRTSGWAVSNDSDFFILCAKGETCRGYVPIDTLEFLVKLPEVEVAPVEEAEDDGFQQVAKRKRKNKPRAALPAETVLSKPPATEEEGKLMAVRFTSYSSRKLAQVLGLAPSMLPLFAALVGNDYTTSVQNGILGAALPSGAERISGVAAILRDEYRSIAGQKTPGVATPRRGLGRSSDSVLSSATATPTRGAAPDLALLTSDPVRAMVSSIVSRLLAREAVSSGDQADVVDSVIDAVCTYSLLAAPQLAAATSARFFAHTNETVRQYRELYNDGHFDKALVEALTQRIYVAKQFAEDPDLRSTQVGHARRLRRWTWAVLFESWGMDWARESMDEPPSEDEEEEWTEAEGDPNEVIPVDTPPSSVDGTDDEDSIDLDDLPSRPGSALAIEPNGPKPPPAVREYARKGDRLVGEFCEILPFSSLGEPFGLPSNIAAQDEPERIKAYLAAHGATPADMDGVDRQQWPLVATLRYLINSEHERLGESFRKSNWSRIEVIAAIHPPREGEGLVQPTTRTIHLMSMLQLTLLSSWQLAQSLLLVPSVFHTPPSSLVPQSFHQIALTPDPSLIPAPPLLDAVLRGDLESRLSINVDALRKLKRDKKADRKSDEDKARQAKQLLEQKKKNAFAFLTEQE